MTNLKATKGSVGDFGRIRRGAILTNLSSERAKSLVASGAYAIATDEEVKAAGEAKIIDGLAPMKVAKAKETPDFAKMKVGELKAFAKEREIDLGEAKKRDEILAAITLGLADADGPGDDRSLGDLTDDELKALAEEKGVEIEGEFERDTLIAALELEAETSPAA